MKDTVNPVYCTFQSMYGGDTVRILVTLIYTVLLRLFVGEVGTGERASVSRHSYKVVPARREVHGMQHQPLQPLLKASSPDQFNADACTHAPYPTYPYR